MKCRFAKQTGKIYNHFVNNCATRRNQQCLGFSIYECRFSSTDIDTIEEMALQVFLGFLHPCIYQKDDAASYRQRLTTRVKIAKKESVINE